MTKAKGLSQGQGCGVEISATLISSYKSFCSSSLGVLVKFMEVVLSNCDLLYGLKLINFYANSVSCFFYTANLYGLFFSYSCSNFSIRSFKMTSSLFL